MAREPEVDLRKRTRKILSKLDRLYPDAGCALNRRNPLQLLVAFSSPSDVMPLDLDRERQVITRAVQKAVGAGRLELHFLDHTTNVSLRSALREVKPHIFHFVGHGVFDGQRGYLLFEDDAGKARRVRDRTLREFFEDAHHRFAHFRVHAVHQALNK